MVLSFSITLCVLLDYFIITLHNVIRMFTRNVNNMVICNIIPSCSHMARVYYTLCYTSCKLNLKQLCGTWILCDLENL